MKILIAEDDHALCDTLFDLLNTKGFPATQAYSASQAIELAMEQKFDLLLLDINLTDGTGFDVAKEIQHWQDKTPTLYMTAIDTQAHLQKSFASGGDDYIRKPFAVEELLMRIEAVYRRYNAHKEQIIDLKNDYRYNLLTEQLFLLDQLVTLKPKISKLLYILALYHNKVVGKEQIYEELWMGENLPDSAVLRIYIKELRDLLGAVSIKTFKGVGYKLETK